MSRSRSMPSRGKRRRLQSQYGYLGNGNVGALLMQIQVALIGRQSGGFKPGRARRRYRLVGRKTVAAPASDRQQPALRHPDALPGTEPGLAGAGSAGPGQCPRSGQDKLTAGLAVPLLISHGSQARQARPCFRTWASSRTAWWRRSVAGIQDRCRPESGREPRSTCPRAQCDPWVSP